MQGNIIFSRLKKRGYENNILNYSEENYRQKIDLKDVAQGWPRSWIGGQGHLKVTNQDCEMEAYSKVVPIINAIKIALCRMNSAHTITWTIYPSIIIDYSAIRNCRVPFPAIPSLLLRNTNTRFNVPSNRSKNRQGKPRNYWKWSKIRYGILKHRQFIRGEESPWNMKRHHVRIAITKVLPAMAPGWLSHLFRLSLSCYNRFLVPSGLPQWSRYAIIFLAPIYIFASPLHSHIYHYFFLFRNFYLLFQSFPKNISNKEI